MYVQYHRQTKFTGFNVNILQTVITVLLLLVDRNGKENTLWVMQLWDNNPVCDVKRRYCPLPEADYSPVKLPGSPKTKR